VLSQCSLLSSCSRRSHVLLITECLQDKDTLHQPQHQHHPKCIAPYNTLRSQLVRAAAATLLAAAATPETLGLLDGNSQTPPHAKQQLQHNPSSSSAASCCMKGSGGLPACLLCCYSAAAHCCAACCCAAGCTSPPPAVQPRTAAAHCCGLSVRSPAAGASLKQRSTTNSEPSDTCSHTQASDYDTLTTKYANPNSCSAVQH
jgi:hypothetical protein